MKSRYFSTLSLLCGLASFAAVATPRDASAAYRMISAAVCEDYHGPNFASAWFYGGNWNSSSLGSNGWVYCPLPYDDTIQPYNVTTTYVFVYDYSTTVEATAKACMYDAYALTASCGTPSGSGTSFTGTAYLTPSAAPSAYHYWANYYLDIYMPKDANKYGESLISYYLYQP